MVNKVTDSRKEYTVSIGNLPHTMMLSDEDAARYGDAAVLVKAKVAPTNKAVKPANKAAVKPAR